MPFATDHNRPKILDFGFADELKTLMALQEGHKKRLVIGRSPGKDRDALAPKVRSWSP